MTAGTARPARAREVFLGALVGLFGGVVLAAALVAGGVATLDDTRGALVHGGAALALAAALGTPPRWRAAARPWRATLLAALLTALALRRWFTPWVALDAVGWGSGPAGHVTAVVLPLQGLVAGLIAGSGRATPRARYLPKRALRSPPRRPCGACRHERASPLVETCHGPAPRGRARNRRAHERRS